MCGISACQDCRNSGRILIKYFEEVFQVEKKMMQNFLRLQEKYSTGRESFQSRDFLIQPWLKIMDTWINPHNPWHILLHPCPNFNDGLIYPCYIILRYELRQESFEFTEAHPYIPVAWNGLITMHSIFHSNLFSLFDNYMCSYLKHWTFVVLKPEFYEELYPGLYYFTSVLHHMPI